ncbi:Endonuclease V [Limihaloglobus sulfuriphilus]|uniref:Endonuclease V n=1 Tax=Limihaloglobus sulfuriphilus TaxID=1851148 RepID=A0A1R7T5U1_9BACT|nr:deoxyribonuclease V [Limihaloglobus sulfuriphilus]AQQ71773.1 Endonuclease V [Limihaloglobus sulfuriphilus]
MKIRELHGWDLSPKEAVALQRQLAGKISLNKFHGSVNLVAGVDCAFTDAGKTILCCCCVVDIANFETIETVRTKLPVNFPYVPGLLSFREAPVCIKALRLLKTLPDAVIFDGQGIAHPRRLGLAAHIGLLLNIPTVGCAKSRLCGEYREPGPSKGQSCPLLQKGEPTGKVLRTRDNVRPVFVSPGNNCSIDDAAKITLACCSKYRLPEPTRRADKLVAEFKKNIS